MKRTRINPISEKQEEELALRAFIKGELIQEQLNTVGYVYCVNCKRGSDWRGIQLRHKIALSQGGKTDKENCYLWCGICHDKDHGIIDAEVKDG